MIKINLLGSDAANDSTAPLWIGGYAASVVLLLAVFFLMHHSVSSELDIVGNDVESLERQLAAVKKTTKEVRELEAKQNSLEEMLVVIARLKRNKLGPVRVLDDLNLSIPERAWLTSVEERAGSFRMLGLALDNQTIAQFMRELESSDYFDRVQLIESKQARYEGVNMRSFSLNARVRYAGSLVKRSEEGESVL